MGKYKSPVRGEVQVIRLRADIYGPEGNSANKRFFTQLLVSESNNVKCGWFLARGELKMNLV